MTEIISECERLEIHLIAASYFSLYIPSEATFAFTFCGSYLQKRPVDLPLN
jgi:hypothetical protein